LGTSYTVLSVPALASMAMPLAMGGAVSTLVGFIGASYMSPKYIVEEEKISATQKIEIIKSSNNPLRLGLYGLGTIGLGLSAAPLFLFANMINPSILPTAIGLTTAIFGGASLVAYKMPKDKMLGYGKALMGSVLGLIGLQVVGLISTVFVGPNIFAMTLMSASNYIAVGLFTALIAYDTHVSIKMYEEGKADHIGMAVQFLLDFWNILTSLVRIFSSND